MGMVRRLMPSDVRIFILMDGPISTCICDGMTLPNIWFSLDYKVGIKGEDVYKRQLSDSLSRQSEFPLEGKHQPDRPVKAEI